MMKKLYAFAVAFLLLVAVGTRVSHAGPLFGTAYQPPVGETTLYSIDPGTGAATPIGPVGFLRVGAIAFSPTGALFGVSRDATTGETILIAINTTTGAGTLVGPLGSTGLQAQFDISFRSDGTLFGVGFGSTVVDIVTINTSTGVATEVGGTGFAAPGNGLGFSIAGTLFHVDADPMPLGGDGTLYTIDQSTGAATPLAPLTFSGFPLLDFPRINALTSSPDGALFASVNDGGGASGPNYLGILNPGTGVVTFVGESVVGLDGLAFQTVIPEPASVLVWSTIALVGVGVTLGRRWRRR